MAFECTLMDDPVVAADGHTYNRVDIEKWLVQHDTSPLTNETLESKALFPNIAMRRQINMWREQHGLTSLNFGKIGNVRPLVASGPASSPLMQKPVVMCERHPMERLRVFCKNCDRAVCTLCAIDIDICKPHDTKVIDDLLGNLKAEKEEWAHACEECRRDTEQLCSAIQANADAIAQEANNRH